MSSSPRELVKLYYRIGEVSQIVGVQPHVLRYWETEFRTIRPQKSHKGQRVYSRRDVEKLLKVKDLLKNQGFTIAGAKKKLREPDPEPLGTGDGVAPAAPMQLVAAEPARDEPPVPASAAPVAAITPVPATPVATIALAPLAPVAVVAPAPSVMSPIGAAAAARLERARMREALLAIRDDIASMLRDLESPPRRPKLPSSPG